MNRAEALAFCELLYGNPRLTDEGLHIEVMSITPGKRGKVGYSFCQTTSHAADTAIKIAEEGNNAYVCMALVDPKTITKKRGTADDAKAIVGFWADIDIADPMTPKPGKNPPINQQEAMAIAKGTGLMPSVVVHSGHGIHCYWLFTEPWIFTSDEERREAADRAKAWELTLHQVARDRGRSLDSVGDLARVLRVPGTINSKVEIAPIDVRLIWPPPGHHHRVKRYPRPDVEAHIKAPAPEQTGEVVNVEKLANLEMRFPTENEQLKLESKIAVACLNDPTFKSTWDRDRLDFASAQHSASEYEMSLASQTVGAGWSDQEVYWVMLLWRKQHNEDTEKLLKRKDYIELTIAKAKKGNVMAVSMRKITEISAVLDHMAAAPVPATPEQKQERDKKREEQEQAAFNAVSGMIGAKITGFHRDGKTSGANYYLDFENIRVNCGTSKETLDINDLRSKLMDQAKLIVGGIKREDWFDAVRLLMRFITEEHNPYLEAKYRWLSYLVSYTDQAPHIKDTSSTNEDEESDDTLYQCISRKAPFILNGQGEPMVWFSLEAFRSHVNKVYGDRTPVHEMTVALRGLGASPVRRCARAKGRKRIDRFVWGIPASVLSHQMRYMEQPSDTQKQLPAPSE